MRLSERQKEILKAIGTITLASTVAILAPNLLQILKPSDKQKRYRYKKSLKTLVDHDIIYLFGEEIRLTEKGKELYRIVEIEDIKIPVNDHWDRVWHLVCYDIPEKKKKERDYFKNKLLESGFWAVQDSLWVYPWDCKEEIAVISQNLGISPYVAYLNTDYLPGQDKLIRRFSLEKD